MTRYPIEIGDPDGPIRLGGSLSYTSPMNQPIIGDDAPWEKIMDSGLGAGGFAKCFLGVLDNTDGTTTLYLFGSNGQEKAGAMAGVWQRDGGLDSWARLSNPSFDYNGLVNYGARSYNGNLYVGDRRLGKLYKLSGSTVSAVATVGGEDVFPTLTVQGKLWLGTFGDTTTHLNPGFYSYDGASVVRVLETDLGEGGSVTGVAYDGAKFYVAGQNLAATVHSIWTVTAAGVTAKVFTETVTAGNFLLTTWGHMMIVVYGSSRDVWRYDPPDTFTKMFDMGGSQGGNAIGVGDTLYYTRNGSVYRNRFTGPVSTYSGTLGNAIVSWLVFDGYLWAVTNQPVQLWRRRIGFDRYVGAQALPGILGLT